MTALPKGVMTPNYVYRCVVTRVVDGDTVDVEIDLGFNMRYKDRVRMMGIDTPESRTRNKVEKKLGKASKARLKELIIGNFFSNNKGTSMGTKKQPIYLKTSKEGKGKFGRILGTLWKDGYSINDILIAEGHARPYFGGSKDEYGEWTKQINGTWHRWTSEGYVEIDE